MGVTNITGMAITDRFHMLEYITPAIIDRLAAYEQAMTTTMTMTMTTTTTTTTTTTMAMATICLTSNGEVEQVAALQS